MKGKSKTIKKAGIVLLVISLIGWAIGSVINPVIVLPAVYLIVLGCLLDRYSKEHSLYVFISWTAISLLLFDCWASLGIGPYFLPGCAIGIGLSLLIYISKRFTYGEKQFSYLGMILVIIACCYFITRYLTYARFASIAVGVLVILHNLLAGRLHDKTNDL